MRESFQVNKLSCVGKREEIARTDCVHSATDCNLGVVLEN
jgi:hypothetical protein